MRLSSGQTAYRTLYKDTVLTDREKKNIILAVREILDKKLVRASPHFFNTESEIQKVVDEIRRL